MIFDAIAEAQSKAIQGNKIVIKNEKKEQDKKQLITLEPLLKGLTRHQSIKYWQVCLLRLY